MVPLVRNPEGTEDICVHCGRVIPVTEEYSLDETNQTSMQSQEGTDLGRDTSELLAERMVQGWKMLSKHCPICSTPLIEKMNCGMYCVSCDMPVRNEAGSIREEGDGQLGEETEHQKSIKASKIEVKQITELKRSVATHILEYMNSISLSLLHSLGDNREEFEERIHTGTIVSQLSECADIVSKIDGLNL